MRLIFTDPQCNSENQPCLTNSLPIYNLGVETFYFSKALLVLMVKAQTPALGNPHSFKKAVTNLKKHNPKLAKVIYKYTILKHAAEDRIFQLLVESILGQQLYHSLPLQVLGALKRDMTIELSICSYE